LKEIKAEKKKHDQNSAPAKKRADPSIFDGHRGYLKKLGPHGSLKHPPGTCNFTYSFHLFVDESWEKEKQFVELLR